MSIDEYNIRDAAAKNAEVDTSMPSRAIQEALSLAGSCSDLDWEQMEWELYRIRHESQPTPPISLWDAIFWTLFL